MAIMSIEFDSPAMAICTTFPAQLPQPGYSMKINRCLFHDKTCYFFTRPPASRRRETSICRYCVLHCRLSNNSIHYAL